MMSRDMRGPAALRRARVRFTAVFGHEGTAPSKGQRPCRIARFRDMHFRTFLRMIFSIVPAILIALSSGPCASVFASG